MYYCYKITIIIIIIIKSMRGGLGSGKNDSYKFNLQWLATI